MRAMKTQRLRSTRLFAAAACVAIVAAQLAAAPALARHDSGARRSIESPMPVISRNVPAYANDPCDGQCPASLANDSSYDTQWRTCNVPSVLTPMFIAYDLSAVPDASLSRVVVAWYNDPATSSYDHNFIGIGRPVGIANDIPSTYTLEAN